VLLQVDGHRLNEPLYDSAFNMTDFILDLDLVDLIEVIRGPGSSIYGNNAFFSVINVVTRRGGDVNGTEVSASAGSFDTFQGRVTYGKKFSNDVEVLVSGTLYNSEGPDNLFYPEFHTRRDHFGVAHELDGDAFQSAFASIAYHDFTLRGGYISRDKEVPTASFDASFNDPRAHTVDKRGFLALDFAHDFPNDIKVQGRLYGDYYEFGEVDPLDQVTNGPPQIVLNKDSARAWWWGAELEVSKIFFDRHRLMVGGEVRQDVEVIQQNYDVVPRTVYLNTESSPGNEGVFAEANVAVLTNLTINGGVRYDHYSTFGDTVNPRAAVIYSPVNGTTIKLLYGQAFRAPNEAERDYSSPYSKVNHALKPETISSYEAVVEQALGRHLRASASAFQNDINDLISQEIDPADGLLVYRNTDQVRARGIEIELDGQWKSGVRGRISYSLQETEDIKTGERLSNAPEQLAKLNLSVPLFRTNIFAGIEVQYVGERLTLLRREADEFAVVNLTLFSRELVKGLEASATLYNLFDTRYGYPGAGEHRQDIIMQDGRTFRVKLTYRF